MHFAFNLRKLLIKLRSLTSLIQPQRGVPRVRSAKSRAGKTARALRPALAPGVSGGDRWIFRGRPRTQIQRRRKHLSIAASSECCTGAVFKRDKRRSLFLAMLTCLGKASQSRDVHVHACLLVPPHSSTVVHPLQHQHQSAPLDTLGTPPAQVAVIVRDSETWGPAPRASNGSLQRLQLM